MKGIKAAALVVCAGLSAFLLGMLVVSANDPIGSRSEPPRVGYIAPPPEELWEPEPLPADLEQKGGCLVPKAVPEVTKLVAAEKNQRVFDGGDVMLYARADGTCVSLVKGDGPPPDFAPDDIKGVSPDATGGQ